MKRLVISILFYISCYSAFSQKVLSLRECIGTGLEKNYSILISDNNSQIAENNYTLGNAGFLPSADLSGRYSGTLNNTENTTNDGTKTKNSGVSGTNSSAGLSVNIPIFNGFNAVMSYRRLGELNELGQLNLQFTIENLISDIVAGYYNYLLQIQMLNNMKYALSLSHDRLRIDRDRYLLGSGSKLEVLQSQVYVNSDSSQFSRQTEVVRSARIRLNEMMALEDLGNEFIIEDTAILVNPDLLYEKLLDQTLSNNTELRIALKNKTVSDYDYRLVRSRSYPYLNFSGGYTFSYNTSNSGINRSTQTNGMNYGVTLGLNLFDGFNQQRNISNSIIVKDNSDLRYRETEQGIKADLLTTYNAYSNYLRLTNLEEQNLSTAAENLDIALERYRLGSLSGIELREVQKSLLDANERQISAHYQTKLAEITLRLISGQIMTYYK
jgi:outer membrane protein TolC